MHKSPILIATIFAAALATSAFAQGPGGTGGGNTDATVSKGETGSTKVAAPKKTMTTTRRRRKQRRCRFWRRRRHRLRLAVQKNRCISRRV